MGTKQANIFGIWQAWVKAMIMCRSRNNCFHVNCCHHGEKDTNPLHHLCKPGAFCSKFQTMTLVLTFQSCTYEVLTERACPHQAEEPMTRLKSQWWHLLTRWKGTLHVTEHSLHNQHEGKSGNSCWSISKKVNSLCLGLIALTQILYFLKISVFSFIWLCWVLVVACGIFIMSCRIFHCSTQAL